MASEKILNSRVQLKYDTLVNWQSSVFNGSDASKYLKAGELAIVTLAPNNEPNPTHTANQHPLLFKVGTGNHKFDDLPWASAKAADVYDWAKQASLPVTKEGTGNVVASIAWDEATKSIKFTTASVATSEGMEQLANRVTTIENTYATDAELAAAVETINAAVALKAAQADLEAVSAVANAAATQTALAAEIERAMKAEKANADAIALLTDGVDQTKVDGVKDLIDYVEEHGPEVTKMKEDIAANTKAISDEAARADTEEKRLAGLIGTNTENIRENAEAITALGITDGKVANATMADKANSLTDNAKAEVKAVKVDNATNADVATDANKLGGVAAEQYATKAYADQAEADAISSANANTANVIKNYYTKTEADAAFMDSTETGNAIDAKIAALNLPTTYEAIGAEGRAKAYADSLAGNYATAAQGTKADSALQEVTAGTGLKVTNKNHVEFDTDVVFVFSCGSSTEII